MFSVNGKARGHMILTDVFLKNMQITFFKKLMNILKVR